jgi:hypothetical protein
MFCVVKPMAIFMACVPRLEGLKEHMCRATSGVQAHQVNVYDSYTRKAEPGIQMNIVDGF